MAQGIPFQDIEKKWQEIWERDQIYRACDPSEGCGEKFYGLIEFPYPSGEGLHVGHPRSYTALDIMTRKRRMEGKNVLYPIGWDAFGLPTENFAIKHKIKPQDATKNNVVNFKRQLQSLGFGFDWSREVNTTDPAYYKWTQWMFLKFFESYYDEIEDRARPINELAIPDDVGAQFIAPDREASIRQYRDSYRMAYKAEVPIHWCPSCKIGLAKEEAQSGVCERCGTSVEERMKSQWMIRITKYAERLIKDLDTVDYLEKIKTQQINWIGKSEGAIIEFSVVIASEAKQSLERASRRSASRNNGQTLPDHVIVFTTRPDTLFGATYLVLAPEHPMLEALTSHISNLKDMQAYCVSAAQKTEIERQESREKTGIELKGVMAKNPATGEEMPIWVADYVLGHYGTGAIMAVPAHDERDFEFAKKFGLQRKLVVIKKGHSVPEEYSSWSEEKKLAHSIDVTEKLLPFIDGGLSVNSGMFNGLATLDAKEKMIEWLEENHVGHRTTTYKLRDWVFSRQRYWGEPIPIIICKTCGYVSVPDEELPVTLPAIDAYEPTDTGESPLAKMRDWVEVRCPQCGGDAERETDTMPNWAGSSWYFLRYCDPHNDRAFADSEKLKYWMPVDLYNGGMEHTTLHLLYSRFWYKFLWDLGHVPRECGSEPYAKRRSHALILGEGGVKMSKSKGNVVNPDDVVEKYGADVFRVYEMFIGPFDADAPWDTNGIEGVKRFLEKIRRLFEISNVVQNSHSRESGNPVGDGNINSLLHQTIKKVGDDIEAMRFNTAVSAMMICVNQASSGELNQEQLEMFLKLIAPFAPHLAEELWYKLGHTTTIHRESWPTFDPNKIVAETYELVVQVNGKVRDRVKIARDVTEQEATNIALASEKVQAHLGGKKPSKIIFIAGRLLSIVT